MGTSIEGARPRNAYCERCGYVFGGVAIRHGLVTCPECGSKNRFELQSPTRESAARRAARWVLWLVAFGVVLGVLIALFFGLSRLK